MSPSFCFLYIILRRDIILRFGLGTMNAETKKHVFSGYVYESKLLSSNPDSTNVRYVTCYNLQSTIPVFLQVSTTNFQIILASFGALTTQNHDATHFSCITPYEKSREKFISYISRSTKRYKYCLVLVFYCNFSARVIMQYRNNCISELALAYVHEPKADVVPKKFSIKDIIGDGILLAVPKFRRTIEKRWKRKFGSPEYVWKMLVQRNDIKVCQECGHHHEKGRLCGRLHYCCTHQTFQFLRGIRYDFCL